MQGATVEVVHEPSGTKYKTVSQTLLVSLHLPGLRIGGPYKVTISYVGFKSETVSELYVQLGDPIVLEVGLSDNKGELKEVGFINN